MADKVRAIREEIDVYERSSIAEAGQIAKVVRRDATAPRRVRQRYRYGQRTRHQDGTSAVSRAR